MNNDAYTFRPDGRHIRATEIDIDGARFETDPDIAWMLDHHRHDPGCEQGRGPVYDEYARLVDRYIHTGELRYAEAAPDQQFRINREVETPQVRLQDAAFEAEARNLAVGCADIARKRDVEADQEAGMSA